MQKAFFIGKIVGVRNTRRGGYHPPVIFIICKHSKRGYTRIDFCENEQAAKSLLLREKVADACRFAAYNFQEIFS